MYGELCCGDDTGLGQTPEDGGVDWIALIPGAVNAWNSLSGGDAGWEACWPGYDNKPFEEICPDTPSYDAVMRAVEEMPDADIQTLLAYLLGANYGRGPKTRSELKQPACVPFWVKALLGGKDCQASTYPDAPGWFLAKVEQYGAPRTIAERVAGSSIAAYTTPRNLAAIAAAGLALVFLPKALGMGR